MSKNTEIILIRHGESLANAQRIYLGQTDWDLSARGKEQALIAAEHLRERQIDAIYSSDLIRAYNTALPHSEIHGLPITTSRELREINIGKWEGMKIEDMERAWPKEFCVDWLQNFGTCQVPGGESVPHLAERIYNEIFRISRENEGKTVVIACHAAAIRAFWGKVTGTPPEHVAAKIPFPTNASCTTVFFNGERLTPGQYSDDHYLAK